MRVALVAAAAVAIIGTACRAEDQPASVWFHEAPADVSDKLANFCANKGGTVAEQDDRHVLCTKPVSGMRGVLAQAMLGNSYSTSPVLNARFAVLKDGPATRVQVTQWVELQMALGQIRRTPLNGQKQNGQIENELVALGGTMLPPDAWAAPPATAAPPAPAGPSAAPSPAAPVGGSPK